MCISDQTSRSIRTFKEQNKARPQTIDISVQSTKEPVQLCRDWTGSVAWYQHNLHDEAAQKGAEQNLSSAIVAVC